MHLVIFATLLQIQLLAYTQTYVASGQGWSMAADKYGNVFWADSGQAAVYKLSVDGSVNAIATGIGYAASVAVDSTGNVYVMSAKSYTYLLRMCPYLDGVTYGACQDVTYVTGLTEGSNGAQGLAVTSSHIYVSDSDTWQVRRYPFNGAYELVGQDHVQVYALCSDYLDNVYIANFGNGNIQKITPAGVQTVVFNCAFPDGLSTDKFGNLYVASWGSGEIFKVAPDLSWTVVASGFNQPYSVAVDINGNMFVGDTGNYQIVKISGLVTTTSTTLTQTTTSTSTTQAMIKTTSSITSSTQLQNGSAILDQTTRKVIEFIPEFTSEVLTTTEPEIVLTFQASKYAIEQSTSVLVNEQQSVPIFASLPFITPLMLAILGGVVLVLLIILIGCSVRRRMRQVRTKTLNQVTSQDINYTQIVTLSGGATTLLGTIHELSVPGHLKREFGVDFIQMQQLAQGGVGSIHRCRLIKPFTQKEVVIKNFGMNVEAMPVNMRDSFYQEVALYNVFRDQDQFARCFGYTETPACILLQFYEYGSLTQLIYSGSQSYGKIQLQIIMVQVAIGIRFMHSRALVHSDLKPDNILLERRYGLLYPKITDFGISRLVDPNKSQVKAFQVSQLKGMSVSYASPEQWQRHRNRKMQSDQQVWMASDTYSLAIIYQELMTRRKVWRV